jgi:hypothetical protein
MGSISTGMDRKVYALRSSQIDHLALEREGTSGERPSLPLSCTRMPWCVDRFRVANLGLRWWPAQSGSWCCGPRACKAQGSRALVSQNCHFCRLMPTALRCSARSTSDWNLQGCVSESLSFLWLNGDLLPPKLLTRLLLKMLSYN